MVHSAPNQSLAKQATNKFKKYGGEDEEIDAFELQKVLNDVFTKGKILKKQCREIPILKICNYVQWVCAVKFHIPLMNII